MMNNTLYGFNMDQEQEIRMGLDAGLDVTCYAKPELLAIQMRQIRLGLESGLDVSVYNTTEYDWFQMEEIRKGMKAGVAYEVYANPEVDYQRMRQVRKGLEQGIDLSVFVKLEVGILEELRRALVSKVSIVEYIKEGYDVEQLTEIRQALEKKLDIRPHINVELRGASIHEIALGLEEGLAVENYASMEYSWQQMREIRLGMEARVDVSTYNNPLFTWQQMREIRLGLQEGIDVSKYISFVYMASDMKKIREQLMEERVETIVNQAENEIEDELIHIFLSNDEMEACVEVWGDESKVITSAKIKERLAAHGINCGLMEREIESLVKEKKYGKTVVVARGKYPQQGTDGRYEFYFNTRPTKTPKILEDGSADFRTIDWFEMVTEGQEIARYYGAGSGVHGYTVTGVLLDAPKGKEKAMISGRGFRLLDDGKTYVATLSGKIDLIGENKIEITSVCIFDEVNLATGNIYFDGSIYVRGNVQGGVSITATQNVVVNGFVESSSIRCGGEVCLRQGVNGGGVGLIEAGKGIMGQFFEAVRVVSQGDISAHYAMNCDMAAEGAIMFHGARSKIIGGRTYGAMGIEVANVGNKVGLRTRLHVGVNDEQINRERQLDVKIEGVKRELSILQNSYNEFKRKYTPEVRNAMDMFLKIENAIYTKELQLKGLIEEREQMEEDMKAMKEAKVVVRGAMYEGTEVKINNMTWEAFGVRDVTIRCKKKIIVESN